MNGKDLGGVPDDRYDLYVRRKIRQGIEDIETGRTLSEEEFDRRMAKWLWTPAGAP